MADKKITQLDPITGANLADTDEFVVVDLSADETKSITFAELKNGFDTGTGFVRITGDTMTGNLSFGDSNKIIMGAGSDLQLYHDGTRSYLDDVGSGSLWLRGGDVAIKSTASETMAEFANNGAATLYYDNAVKFATTSTGADVTGTLTTDAITSSGQIKVTSSNASTVAFSVGDTNTGLYNTGSNSLGISTAGTFRMLVDSSGQVGIGTASPNAILDVRRGDASGKIAEFHTSTGFGIELGSSQSEAYIQAGSSQALLFNTNGSNERMRIDSSGNVGIGTSSPDAPLELEGNNSSTTQFSGYGGLRIHNANGSAHNVTAEMYFTAGTGSSNRGAAIGSQFTSAANGNDLYFATNGGNVSSTNTLTERMRIDSSGRLLVAKTTTAFGTVGHTIWNDGSHDLTASAIPPIQANRLTSDGDIIALYKASSKMGSLGNAGTNFIIQQSNASGVVQIKNHDSTEDIEFGQDYFRIKQGGAERLRIDTSGNLIKTGGGLISSNGTSDTLVISGSNAVNTGGNITLEGNTASDVSQIKFKNGSTEVMRIASGRVLIGTTTEGHADGDNFTIAGSGNTGMTIRSTNSQKSTIYFSDSTSGAGEYAGYIHYDHSGNNLNIGVNENERMRIDSGGKMYFGTSGADPSSSQTGVRISSTDNTNFWMSSTPRTSAYDQFAFFNGNGLVGTITTSGSATAYNTSSDYRLKTDVQPMTGASERVQALNPVNFEWVADGTRVDGFLAHEAQAVVPESVTGTKDAVDADGNPEYQSIDQSKIVPLLTAALQEALTEITALKARVTTLEGA